MFVMDLARWVGHENVKNQNQKFDHRGTLKENEVITLGLVDVKVKVDRQGHSVVPKVETKPL